MSLQLQPPTVDPCRCPLCGQANVCAMAAPVVSTEPCWCTRVHFSADLLKQVPEVARNQACICAACVAASQDKPEATSKDEDQGKNQGKDQGEGA